uniref:Regulatory protein zeste n=1 Tax=Timema bartmani TaxID=61472 RepID=A0A7R9HZ59_9NEOP|nr:unnamed protein product [Timema bartmani]
MSINKEESKKTRRYTTAQIVQLVDYMSNHSELASSRFSCPISNDKLDRQWEALAKILEKHGPKKTVAQWKIVWRDLKCKVRGRLAEVNKLNSAPGKEKSAPPLTELELKVRAIITTVNDIGEPSTCERGLKMFELIQNEVGENLDPQAGPSLPLEQGYNPPSLQAKNMSESLGNSFSSSSRKSKKHKVVEEWESTVKIFTEIQKDHKSSNKEIANAITRLASAQEELLGQQMSVAFALETAVAAHLESNKLQAEANRLQAESNRGLNVSTFAGRDCGGQVVRGSKRRHPVGTTAVEEKNKRFRGSFKNRNKETEEEHRLAFSSRVRSVMSDLLGMHRLFHERLAMREDRSDE